MLIFSSFFLSLSSIHHDIDNDDDDYGGGYLVDQRDYSIPSNTITSSSSNQLSNNNLQQRISTESIRRNLPSSNYYPIIQLNKQSIINKYHKSSFDDIPNWCNDDMKISSYSYDNKQPIDLISSHYFKNDLSQKRLNTSPYSSSYKSSSPKPDTFMKSRSSKKTNLAPSHAGRPISRNTNVPSDTRQRIISQTQSLNNKSTQMTTSSLNDNTSLLRTKNVAKKLNTPKKMVFVQVEQAFANSLNKLYEQDEGKNQNESQQIFPLKCDNKTRTLSIIHNDEITNLDCFFYLWNLFNVTPVDSDIISVGPVVMDRCCLFQYFSQEKCCYVWFTKHPPYIDNRNISSLILLLETFIGHIFQSNLEVHYMESLSCLILLSWWNIAFGHLESYQIIAYELYNVWIRLIPQIVEKASLIIDQFSSYPEHLNLFIINLLRIYVDHNFQKENVWKLSKDTASQMTGIHSSVNMHGLIGIYRKSIEQLNINNTKSLSTINTLSQTVSINTTCLAIVEILKRLVRLGLADCLKQNPDLPIISFADKQIIERFNMVRDYLLVRASRLLAYELESNVNCNYLPKQFTCLVHVTAPKHLISELLNISLCKSEKISQSKNPHIDLISWTLEQKLNVTDYAFWCVTSIDVKDIEAINYLLSRLLPHAKVLAKDHLFSYSLILHLDRVRKAALPDNEHIKLLRAVFEHLSISSKCDLLTTLQSSLKNSNRSTPLPNSTVHFRTRIRQLFNRLVVSNVNSGDDNYDNNQQVLNLFNKDLLDQLLYVFQVPINFSTGTKFLPEKNNDKFTTNLSEQQIVHSTIFQELILIDWSNRKSYLDISIFGHEDLYDELNNGNLFNVNFQYEEEKNRSNLLNNNKLYQFNMSEEVWSSSKLAENPLLNTIVYLFKKPNCFIQINNIMKYFLTLVENNVMNKSSSHIDHLTTRIQFKAISVVPSLTEQTEDFNSLLSSNTVVRENHVKSRMVISPRLLYFIFELATVSNTLCSEVLKSIINKSLKSNGQLLDHLSKISSGHLLIAIQLFLRKIVKSRQWKCWERLYFLLYKLLKAGVLVYPVPNLISDSQETNDNTPSRLFYLLDWSKLCGSFDLLTLTSDLFNLWCMSLEIPYSQLLDPFQSTNHLSHDTSDKLYHRNTEFYILCHSLCDLVSCLSSVISLYSNKNTNQICNNDNNNNNDCDTVNSDDDIISSLKTNQSIQYNKQLTINLLDQLSNRLSNSLISNLLIKSNSQLNVSNELNRLKQTILLVKDLNRT
uniref:Uncharacterized protein n=1 Tax=Schistosoma haematobium TaxID=6185 RepID=A0A094ZHG4_SCHHA